MFLKLSLTWSFQYSFVMFCVWFYAQTMLQDNGPPLEWFAGGLAFHTGPCSMLLVVFFLIGTHISWPILGHSWIKCQFWSCSHCSTEQPLNNRKPEDHFDVSNDTLHQKNLRPLPPAYTFWRVDPKSWEVTMSSILLQWEKLSKNLRPGWKELGTGQMTNVGWRWCFYRGGGGGVFFWWQSEEFQHFCFYSRVCSVTQKQHVQTWIEYVRTCSLMFFPLLQP